MFHWPEHIQTVFELSQTRILNRREHAEEETKKKVAAFEDRLNEYQKEVDSFRKKEVGIVAILYLENRNRNDSF